jgi:hypothetical protein
VTTPLGAIPLSGWSFTHHWTLFHPPFVCTCISNVLTHCVNLSVTWWPQNFNHLCFFESPLSKVCSFMVSKAIQLHGNLVLSCSNQAWSSYLPKLELSPFLLLPWRVSCLLAQEMFTNTPSMSWPWDTRSLWRSIFLELFPLSFSMKEGLEVSWRHG